MGAGRWLPDQHLCWATRNAGDWPPVELLEPTRSTTVRTILMAIAVSLTACVPTDSGYKDASIIQADESCREQASAATTRAYEIFGYRGHEDRAIDAYKSTFDRCMSGD